MKYTIQAKSISKNKATIKVKGSNIDFGIIKESEDLLPNPAELFLASFSACILKNVERFSQLMHFSYKTAAIEVQANRLEKPPRMDEIQYVLHITSQDKHINIDILKKNIENFGTIFNTIKSACTIRGEIKLLQ